MNLEILYAQKMKGKIILKPTGIVVRIPYIVGLLLLFKDFIYLFDRQIA